MKKMIVALSLILSGVAFAHNTPVMHLNVTITNNTTSTCYLTEKKITDGRLTDENVTLKLLPTETSKQMALYSYKDPSIITTYECVAGSSISLQSKKEKLSECSPGSAEGQILFAKNAYATFDNKTYDHGRKADIHWTLTDG